MDTEAAKEYWQGRDAYEAYRAGIECGISTERMRVRDEVLSCLETQNQSCWNLERVTKFMNKVLYGSSVKPARDVALGG